MAHQQVAALCHLKAQALQAHLNPALVLQDQDQEAVQCQVPDLQAEVQSQDQDHRAAAVQARKVKARTLCTAEQAVATVSVAATQDHLVSQAAHRADLHQDSQAQASTVINMVTAEAREASLDKAHKAEVRAVLMEARAAAHKAVHTEALKVVSAAVPA